MLIPSADIKSGNEREQRGERYEVESRQERRKRSVTAFQELYEVRYGPDGGKRNEQLGRVRPAGKSIEQSFESEKKKSRKKCEKSKTRERFAE